MFQKMLLVLFVLASAGVPVVYFMLPPNFGVAPEHALGEYDKIEKWFLGRDYAKSIKVVDDEFVAEHGDAFRGSRIFKFSFRKRRASAYSRVATVLVLPDGRIRRITASFNSGRSTNHPPDITPHEFVLHLWKQIAGREPVFRREREGYGQGTKFSHVDSLSTKGVKAEWKKLYRDRGRESSIYDVVQFWVDDGLDEHDK